MSCPVIISSYDNLDDVTLVVWDEPTYLRTISLGRLERLEKQRSLFHFMQTWDFQVLVTDALVQLKLLLLLKLELLSRELSSPYYILQF